MKIPKQAKRVFKGEIFEVWQWRQKMFDGTVETFEMVKRPDTTQVIAIYGNKILVALQEQPDYSPKYTLLGGRLDEERPVEGAKRELLEESGMVSDDWELFKEFEPVVKMDWKLYYFVARNCRKVADQKLDNGEKIDVKELSFEEFINIFSENDYGDFTIDLLHLRLDPKKLEQFREKLFHEQK